MKQAVERRMKKQAVVEKVEAGSIREGAKGEASSNKVYKTGCGEDDEAGSSKEYEASVREEDEEISSSEEG